MSSRTLIFIIPLLAGCLCSNAYSQNGFADTVVAPTENDVIANNYYFDALQAKQHDDGPKAIVAFEKFASLKPNDPSVYFELSRLYADQKKSDLAEKNIQKAISLNKKNKWYKEQYSNLLILQNKFGDAAKVMSALSDEYPDDKSFIKQTVELLEQSKQYDEAIKYINKALLTSPNDEEWLMHKVQLLIILKKTDEAVEVLNQLMAHDKQNGRYYKMLGELYDKNKQPDKALKVYQDAEKMMPDDPTLQLGFAEHYMRIGDTATYKAYLRKTIVNKELDVETQLDLLDAYLQNLRSDSELSKDLPPLIASLMQQHPDDPAVLATYGDLMYKENKKEQAVEAYKKSLSLAPSNFNLWARFLGTITDREDADSLVRYSEKAIRLFPNQALAHYYKGIGHYYKKEYSKAITSIKRAIDLQPETNTQRMGSMYGLLGDIYNSNKDYINSEKAYEQAIHFDANDPTILNNYSYFLSDRNMKLDEAEAMSGKSLKLRPDEPSYLDTYGWIEYKKGDFAKARDYVENAIRHAGQSADATLYDHLGNIYFKLNDRTKAVEYWKISKEMGGDDPQLDKKISEEKLYE